MKIVVLFGELSSRAVQLIKSEANVRSISVYHARNGQELEALNLPSADVLFVLTDPDVHLYAILTLEGRRRVELCYLKKGVSLPKSGHTDWPIISFYNDAELDKPTIVTTLDDFIRSG